MEYVSDLRIRTAHYIIAGFSLVVGLSWNDTIKHVIDVAFPLQRDAIYMKVIYSLLITLILIIIIKYLPDTSSQLPPPIQKELFHARLGHLKKKI